MPQFFFDLQGERDIVGAELANDALARDYAVRLAGDIIRDTRPDDLRGHYWRMDVRQGTSRALLSLVFEGLPARPV